MGNDNVQAGSLATQHLIELGHERIAFINGYHGNPASSDRLKGHHQALAAAGISFHKELIVGDGFEFENGRDAVRELLKAKRSFTALVASSDVAALGAIQELGRVGLSVPNDISVVGCGNLDISSMTTPSMTTVDQKPLELGRKAMELLISHIEGTAKSAKKVLVKPAFTVRDSTKRRA